MRKHAMYGNLVRLRTVISGRVWLCGPSGGVATAEECQIVDPHRWDNV